MDRLAELRASDLICESMITNHEHRLLSLETPGGRTPMATPTRERFEAVERQLRDLERQLERLRER